tara:strand:- start:445 stop:864 length:420 start_codon:yes stop_codon:yes gene_type:complete
MLELTNHIDNDGDLDANYALLRNVALTGHMVDGKFVSGNKQRFGWLKECAIKGCPICNGIFEDAKNDNFNIKEFYMKKVVKIVKKDGLVTEKKVAKTKWDKLAKAVTDRKLKKPNKSNKEQDHPLMELIIKKFDGRIIE